MHGLPARHALSPLSAAGSVLYQCCSWKPIPLGFFVSPPACCPSKFQLLPLGLLWVLLQTLCFSLLDCALENKVDVQCSSGDMGFAHFMLSAGKLQLNA